MPVALGDGVTFHSRQDVGLPPNTAPLLQSNRFFENITHYSTGDELGTDDFAQWVRNIDDYHRRVNGWVNGFAYNWAVARDPNPELGHIIEGRGIFRQGGHTLNHNTTGMAVCFLGDDDPNYDDVTPGARRALKVCWFLVQAEQAKHGVTPQYYGHRDFAATGCPGDELYDWVHSGMPVAPFNGVPNVPYPLPTNPDPVVPAFPDRIERPQPTLRRGNINDEVARLQRALNVFSQGLAVDGIFGKRTYIAVRNFQTFWHIGVDGIYGPVSARTLDNALTLSFK